MQIVTVIGIRAVGAQDADFVWGHLSHLLAAAPLNKVTLHALLSFYCTNPIKKHELIGFTCLPVRTQNQPLCLRIFWEKPELLRRTTNLSPDELSSKLGQSGYIVEHYRGS